MLPNNKAQTESVSMDYTVYGHAESFPDKKEVKLVCKQATCITSYNNNTEKKSSYVGQSLDRFIQVMQNQESNQKQKLFK